MSTEILRQVLCDREVLRGYRLGQSPSVELLLRRAFVAERGGDTSLPDHVYRNWRQHRLASVTDLRGLVLRVLEDYSARYLEFRGERLHVAFDRFGAWQDELARLSPLPFIARALWRQFGAPDGFGVGTLEDYARAHLGRFRYTALLTPYAQPVDDLIRRDGLYETHIHLNGSTELDTIWQTALRDPAGFSRELVDALTPGHATNREMLYELYEQVEPDLRPTEVAIRIERARRLRMAMVRQLLRIGGDDDGHWSIERLMGEDERPAFERRMGNNHPLTELTGLRGTSPLQTELLFLIAVIGSIERTPEEGWLATALHAYLLVLNATVLPLTVQQVAQKGFDQFQKFTFTNARSKDEKEYENRFHQLCSDAPGDIALLEGRFSPPDRPEKAERLFVSILRGYVAYRRAVSGGAGRDGADGGTGNDRRPPPVTLATLPEEIEAAVGRGRPILRLVAHFIKRDDLTHPGPSPVCRFSGLRQDIFRCWLLLRQLRDERPLVRHFVTGIDAAANEIHTPPEVFAPLFRAARRAGFVHFTYHVGEDFEHLLSGMRAVQEAMDFLDLRNGNRMGHATAIGIDPELWLERMPQRLSLRIGDHLDNLLFAYSMLMQRGDGGLLPRLADEIGGLAWRVYRRPVDLNLLLSAWRLRHLDPLQLETLHRGGPEPLPDDAVAELELLRSKQSENDPALQLFADYHAQETVRRARDEFVEVEADRIPAADLRWMQDRILADVVRRHVVLETLPTSNVRISFYRNHGEHHVLRWVGLDPKGEGANGPRPSVSVGSDDPGIFACSLRGEYMHLFREFRKRTNEAEAMRLIRELNETGRLYGFDDRLS